MGKTFLDTTYYITGLIEQYYEITMPIIYYSDKKGKSACSKACIGKTGDSVLLKLFINCNARCHTIDVP